MNPGQKVVHILTIKWHTPSKKNSRKGTGRHSHYEPDVYGDIQALGWLTRDQWVGRPVIEGKVRITMTFWCRDERPDGDNKYTTMQDVLVSAGVIRNDNIKHVRGGSWWCEVDPEVEERVEIEIEELQ